MKVCGEAASPALAWGRLQVLTMGPMRCAGTGDEPRIKLRQIKLSQIKLSQIKLSQIKLSQLSGAFYCSCNADITFRQELNIELLKIRFVIVFAVCVDCFWIA